MAVTSNCQNKDLAFDFLASTFGGSTELYDNILSCELLQHGHRQEILMHMQHRMISLVETLYLLRL